MEYKNPRNIFQQKINNIIKKESANGDLISHIFKLQQVFALERIANNCWKSDPDKNTWEVLVEVYNLLGPSKFAELISIVKGKVISLPTEEEYQDSLITSLIYYYKDIQGLSWEQVKDKLELPKLNNIKYGIHVRAFKGFIDGNMASKIKGKVE